MGGDEGGRGPQSERHKCQWAQECANRPPMSFAPRPAPKWHCQGRRGQEARSQAVGHPYWTRQCGATVSACHLRHALILLISLCALPHLTGVQWDRAMPFEGLAEGGWALTVTGSFSGATTYTCRWSPIATTGAAVASIPVAPAAGHTSVVCLTPEWSYAAQRTTLSILDATTGTRIAGPGGTAEVITFVLALPPPPLSVFEASSLPHSLSCVFSSSLALQHD